MRKKENKIYLIVVLLFLLSLILFLSILNLRSNVLLDEKEIPVSLIIGEINGFDLNTSALTFGTITPGSGAQRSLILENSYDFRMKFIFNVEGDIQKYLVFDNIIYLEPGEKKTESISAFVPSGSEYGNYSGIMNIIVKRDF